MTDDEKVFFEKIDPHEVKKPKDWGRWPIKWLSEEEIEDMFPSKPNEEAQ